MSLMEAIASGLVVVATDVGGISEIAEHGTVILAAPGDDQALSRALCRVLEERKALGAQAREKGVAFLAAYSAEQVAEGYLQIYRRLLSPNV